ncbi:MAG TPA: trigger factor [Acidimicrobiales bacterium]|nr:trigger factor [Acidimicrobiales bacterium]
MRATAEPLEGNRVRLSVQVDQQEVDEALDATFSRLARQMRVPGFRPGHVPRRVLEARLGGHDAVRKQAMSDALPDLYARAVQDTDVDPIAPPEIDITSQDDDEFTFDALVEVRPTVSIPGYQGLVVTVPEVAVEDAEVEREIDRLREHSAELSSVPRPARDGDSVTIDLHGGDDLDVEDYSYEVGSGSDIEGLDDHLRGARAGDILQFDAPLPAQRGPEGDASGQVSPIRGSYRVLVKDVKEKLLPAADDEWAAEASEFDSLEELRSDIRARIARIKRLQAQIALRQGALDALIGLIDEDPPETLVSEEVRERLHDLGHRLERRRMTIEQFLQASGRDEQSLLAELQEESARAVKIDLALRALADAEDLEVSDEELDAAIAEMATSIDTKPEELRARLDRAGRLPAVRSDRRKAKALEWLLDHVELADVDGNPVSRDSLRDDNEEIGPGPAGPKDTSETTASDIPLGEDPGAGEGDEEVGSQEQLTAEVET